MTDANGITISNIITNAATAAQGETLNLSFNFKNGYGNKITKLQIELYYSMESFVGSTYTFSERLHRILGAENIYDSSGASVNIPNGSSQDFYTTFAIPEEIAYRFSTYPNTRAVPIYISYVLIESDGTRLGGKHPIDNFHILNRRYTPAIPTFALERATDGTPNDEGENVLTDLKLSLADTTDYAKFLTAKLYYAQDDAATTEDTAIDLTSKISTLLTGVTDSTSLITQTFSRSSDWDFMLVFGDAYESAAVHYSLGHAFANVHLSGASTGGVCFGGFSSSAEGDPRFESRYPAYLYGGISQIGSAKASLRAMGIQYGSIAAQSCANGATLFVVTFDAPFESEPVVFVTPKTDASAASLGYISCMVVSGSVTTSGFSCRVFNNSSTARDIGLDWMAVGVPQYDADAPIVLQRPVAAMTSNNSGGCIVTASTVYSSSYPVWKAFDYKLSTSWACSTSDTAPWIQIQMDVAMKNIAVKIFARNSDYIQNPLAGNIQGSNDGSVWETIGSFSGWDSTATGKLLGTVECNNATAYQYVRINITSHGGSQNYVAIGYITVNGEK